MSNILITVGNKYLPSVTETFYHPMVDMTDLEEMGYLANESCGIYLDLYSDAMPKDIDSETIAEACFYSIEEG